ncbi:MAG: alginate export family protein [Chitinophagales bacterium]
MAEYDHKIFTTKISIQDVRIWGDEAQLSLSDPAGISLHEAWAKLKMGEFFTLKLGRQELVYDDHRLMGNVEWAQQARSHDAIVLGFEKQGWTLNLGGAYNNDNFDLSKTPYTIAGYRALSYFWVNKTFKDKLQMSIIGIANGVENAADTTLYFTGTLGPHLQFTSNGFKANATFYYQFGKLNSGTSVNAFMAAATASYTVKKTKISVGADYLSGNNAFKVGDAKSRTFNTLYATNHKFYGFMDYFINIPAHTDGAGLLDIQLGVQGKFGDKSTLAIDGHYFMLGNDLPDPENVSSALARGLGGEIDAVYSYKIHEMVDFFVGWSVLLPTESLGVINSGTKGRFNNWAWTMITFKPVFFKSKDKSE